jgi:XTP/dITP diphosphohydrolase
MKFVLATFNRDKARELEALLALPGLTLAPVADFAGATSPDETGSTLLENARIKASAALALTGLPSLADDTGLEVDALGGAPGVHAARFAGPGATYDDNVTLLLSRLNGVPAAQRTARFRTAMVAIFPDGRELRAEGVLEGVIVEGRRGSHGFGYDPIFALGDGRTLAEIDDAEKNRISHRAKAAESLSKLLVSL